MINSKKFNFYFILFLLFTHHNLNAQSDYANKNIAIELLVVEYEHGDQFDWGFDVTSGTTGKLSEGSYSPGSSNSLAFKYNFLDQLDPNFKINLKALITKNHAKILTNPHISVKNNENAVIDAQEVQYLILSNSSQFGVTNTIESIKAGVKLNVTPIIKNDSIVELDVVGTISEFILTGLTGQRTTEENSITTKVNVNNGYSLIIGGLIKKEEVEIKGKVPFFGSIPLLGFLFKRKVKKTLIKEIVIYITPHIHDGKNNPSNKLKKAGDRFFEKKEKKENLFKREQKG